MVIYLFVQLGYIFFADISLGTLNRMRLDGTGFTVLDKYYAKNVEGIAVDSIASYVDIVFNVYLYPIVLVKAVDGNQYLPVIRFNDAGLVVI